MKLLRQSTSITEQIGPFVDDTDGFTAEGGLTVAQADIRLSKNGGAWAQSNNVSGGTHSENGYYAITLDATDTATLGRLKVHVYKSGALPVWSDYMVIPAEAYDALVAGTDNLTADLTSAAVTALLAGAVSEPGAVFSWPSTLGAIVGYLGAQATNPYKENNTTKVSTLRNRADSGTIATSSFADDGNEFTRGAAT